MSSSTLYLGLALLIVVLVVLVVAILGNRNVRQRLKLPFMRWDVETTDNDGSVTHSDSSNLGNTSQVDFGEANLFGGEMGDQAGRDIVKGISTSPNISEAQSSSELKYGKKNVFLGKMGDQAGRDIRKPYNDEKDDN